MKKIALLLFSFMLISNETIKAQSIHIMSFNIRYNNPNDGYNAWPHRKQMVESMIRFHKADLIGIQEAVQNQMDDLANMLPDYGYLGKVREPGGEYASIFYRKGRFQLLDKNTFWLSKTPEKMSKGWDAALNRVASWGKFKDKQTGKIFFLLNTHFDHRGQKARRKSAELMLTQAEKINPEKLPMVITGDFNMTETSEPYRIMTDPKNELRFTDLYLHTNLPAHGPSSTWSGFQFPGVQDRRIDYIFSRYQVATLKLGILSDSWSGRFPSDHLPVIAEVLIDAPLPLPQAHAHNDYEHSNPLLDALTQGFTSIEADVFPIDGELYVAHNLPANPKRLPTLSQLYLDPLAQRASDYYGGIYPNYDGDFYLMIDIKKDGEEAYRILKSKLEEYSYLLKANGGPLTIFLSGDRPIETVMNEEHNWVGIDGRPEDLSKGYSSKKMPVVSQRYGNLVGWKGNGEIPSKDKEIIQDLVSKAHAEGKKVRLWASPEQEIVWETLLNIGVDFVNSDELVRLKEFLNLRIVSRDSFKN